VHLINIVALTPTPSLPPPGRHWNPNEHPDVHISMHDLKCLGAFLVVCLVLWIAARIANGSWRPPGNGGGNTWT
jgi:hypothetical protein